MDTTVIYHSADFDGIFCREIARKFLPDANFIGWNFGDSPLPVPKGRFYIMDLPLLEPFGLKIEDGWIARDNPIMSKDERQVQPLDMLDWSNWIWIDHHKTAIEKYPTEIPGYRIDGVAACRLAWQWFVMVDGNSPRSLRPGGSEPISPAGVLPMIQHYKNREVDEPLAVRLAGEYDIWDHRGDEDLEFQYGLRTEEPNTVWSMLLSEDLGYTNTLIKQGKLAMRYARNMDAMWLSESWHIIEWEGRKFLAQNSVQRGSGILDSKDIPETGHDALMLYGFRGKLWTVSLYHAHHRTDLDLSEIAKKYGGGGHKGACGFTCASLPWLA